MTQVSKGCVYIWGILQMPSSEPIVSNDTPSTWELSFLENVCRRFLPPLAGHNGKEDPDVCMVMLRSHSTQPRAALGPPPPACSPLPGEEGQPPVKTSRDNLAGFFPGHTAGWALGPPALQPEICVSPVPARAQTHLGMPQVLPFSELLFPCVLSGAIHPAQPASFRLKPYEPEPLLPPSQVLEPEGKCP